MFEYICYDPQQVRELCTRIEYEPVFSVEYYEHPYDDEYLGVIAIVRTKEAEVAFQTHFYDHWNVNDRYISAEACELLDTHQHLPLVISDLERINHEI